MKTHIRILIADDHQMFLDGLQLIFENNNEYKIVAEAHNGEEVLHCMGQQTIDVAILDINMPKRNGFETCKIIRSKYALCKIIILSMYNELQFVEEFMKSGASAYVLKNAGKAELLNAIDVAIRGGNYISKELRVTPINDDQDSFVKSHRLTKREKEIIQLLAEEKSSNEIAEQLFLSVFTVNTHRKNIHQKLGIKNAAGLVKFAIDNHLI